MTPKRAKRALKVKGLHCALRYAFPLKRFSNDKVGEKVHKKGITEEEHEYIMQVWREMNGSCSYYDALCKIARGDI